MNCVMLVTEALEGLEEVEMVEYDAGADAFRLRLVRGPVPEETIVRAIKETGQRHDQRLGRSDRSPWRVRFLSDSS